MNYQKQLIILILILTAFFFVTYSCTLQPGGGNGGGNTSSTGVSSSNPGTLSVVYVASNGSDTNSGTNKTEPFLNLQKALDMASDGASINVALGVYTNGNGLNIPETGTGAVIINKNNIRLLGGWDADFTSRSGYSELDGNKLLYHIIFILNSSHILIDGFVIRNGSATNSASPDNYGGGIVMTNCSHCTLSNTVVSNNSGGGIADISGRENTFDLTVTGNPGTGIIVYGTSNTIEGVICSNHAGLQNGGGVSVSGSFNNINAFICWNTSGANGGGGSIGGVSNTVGGCIMSNSCDLYGGGIYFWNSSFNIMSALVSSNSALAGGGVEFEGRCSFNTVTGNITLNSASSVGGGIDFAFSGQFMISNIISGNITGNTANYGGGIQIEFSSNCLISGNITGNTAASIGGGILIRSCVSNTITGRIVSNTAQWGGAIYLQEFSRLNLITNAFLFYNSGAGGVICMETNFPNLIIDSTIGGQGTGYGIYEYKKDVSGQTIANNIFLTNTLDYLYHDFADGDIGLTEIGVLNTPNDPRHDAFTTYGNSVSNE